MAVVVFTVCVCQDISLRTGIYVIRGEERKQTEQSNLRTLAHEEEAAAPLEMAALTRMRPANTDE